MLFSALLRLPPNMPAQFGESPLLFFEFWEPVYHAAHDPSFPSESNEKLGRFVGIAENVGHALTLKVLDESTTKVLSWSHICSACNTGCGVQQACAARLQH